MVQNAVRLIPVRETRGSKPNVTPARKRGIIRCVKKNPFISSKQISDLNINIDSSRIRKILIKDNLKAHGARKVPMLLKKNIQQRLKFSEVDTRSRKMEEYSLVGWDKN